MRRRVDDDAGLAVGRGSLDDASVGRGLRRLRVGARTRLAVFNHGAGSTGSNGVCGIVGAADGSRAAIRGLGRSRRRHDWRGTTTRRSKTHALVDVFDQCASVGTLAQGLDSHRLAVFLVHDREVFSIDAVDVIGDDLGAALATLTEGITAGLEGEGAGSAVAHMALEFVDDQLFVVVEVAHHDGGLDDLDGAGHCVGAADSEEPPSEAATRRRGRAKRSGGAIGRHRDGLLEDHARDGGCTADEV